jgi:hypothetical protein
LPAAAASTGVQLHTPDVRSLLTDQLSENANGR